MNEHIGYESAFIDNTQEQEAHFFWTISDFEELIKAYGAEMVIRSMSPDLRKKVVDYIIGAERC